MVEKKKIGGKVMKSNISSSVGRLFSSFEYKTNEKITSDDDAISRILSIV